jgi:2-polyprenyl-3-methyl-5-hydroxy-6-metoxy-1,4-benzoquinol methylase
VEASSNIYSSAYLENLKSASLLHPAENFIRIYNVILKAREQYLPAHPTFMDVGFGDGRHLEYMHEHGYKCFGTDISDSAISLTELRINRLIQSSSEHTAPDISLFKIQESEARPKDFHTKIDVICCWETLHWFGSRQNITKAIESWIEMLSQDGRIVLTLPSEEHCLVMSGKPVGDNCFSVTLKGREDAIIFGSTKNDYIELFQNCGLSVESIWKYSRGRVIRNQKDYLHPGSFVYGEDDVIGMYAFTLTRKQTPT